MTTEEGVRFILQFLICNLHLHFIIYISQFLSCNFQFTVLQNTWKATVTIHSVQVKYGKKKRCDSYLQIWNYQSLTDWLTHWQG